MHQEHPCPPSLIAAATVDIEDTAFVTATIDIEDTATAAATVDIEDTATAAPTVDIEDAPGAVGGAEDTGRPKRNLY